MALFQGESNELIFVTSVAELIPTTLRGLNLYLSDNSPIGTRPEEGYIITLSERNYTGSELASELQSKMNTAVSSSVITNKTFTCAYNPYNQTISILIGISTTFKLLYRRWY